MNKKTERLVLNRSLTQIIIIMYYRERKKKGCEKKMTLLVHFLLQYSLMHDSIVRHDLGSKFLLFLQDLRQIMLI